MRMKTSALAAITAALAVVLFASPAGADEPTPTRPGGLHTASGPGPSAIVDPWVTPSEAETTAADAPQADDPADAPTLPKTGPEGLLVGGAGLVIVGVGLLVVARRRRDSHAA
jgi:LPXTG-motif cell wall-anchored protein